VWAVSRAAPSTALATIQPAFTESERLALAGFLVGYRGLTREAYTLDLRQFTGWCRTRSVPLFSVGRAYIETFARELEARGRARATVTRRLCTIAGFYRYAVEEELLDHSPAAHVRRPRLDYESHATGADIEHLGLERGHRTLVITRKGGKVVTIPLAPRTARAIDLAIGERTDGPLLRRDRQACWPSHAAARSLCLVGVAITTIGRQADLRPALFDSLLLAAACRGTTEQRGSSAAQLPKDGVIWPPLAARPPGAWELGRDDYRT
jgi:integrase